MSKLLIVTLATVLQLSTAHAIDHGTESTKSYLFTLHYKLSEQTVKSCLKQIRSTLGLKKSDIEVVSKRALIFAVDLTESEAAELASQTNCVHAVEENGTVGPYPRVGLGN